MFRFERLGEGSTSVSVSDSGPGSVNDGERVVRLCPNLPLSPF